LVDWLVAPKCFGKSWIKFGIPSERIVHYDGLEELAWLKGTKFEQPKFLKELEVKRPVILFRDAEYQAVYCKDVAVDSHQLIRELAKLATVVCLPRYEEERKTLAEIPNVWVSPKPVLTAQLIPYIDIMVGSGGTACRETALCGIPTINFHFWDVQAKYLHRKGFPIRILRDTNRIVKTTKRILKNPQYYRVPTSKAVEKIESPLPAWAKYVELSLKKKAL
jgi:predicted glycosyltransferase